MQSGGACDPNHCRVWRFLSCYKCGRIIGAAVMANGIRIIAVYTAFIADSFLKPRKKKREVAFESENQKTNLANIKKVLEDEEIAQADFKEHIEKRIEGIEFMRGSQT